MLDDNSDYAVTVGWFFFPFSRSIPGSRRETRFPPPSVDPLLLPSARRPTTAILEIQPGPGKVATIERVLATTTAGIESRPKCRSVFRFVRPRGGPSACQFAESSRIVASVLARASCKASFFTECIVCLSFNFPPTPYPHSQSLFSSPLVVKIDFSFPSSSFFVAVVPFYHPSVSCDHPLSSLCPRDACKCSILILNFCVSIDSHDPSRRA